MPPSGSVFLSWDLWIFSSFLADTNKSRAGGGGLQDEEFEKKMEIESKNPSERRKGNEIHELGHWRVSFPPRQKATPSFFLFVFLLFSLISPSSAFLSFPWKWIDDWISRRGGWSPPSFNWSRFPFEWRRRRRRRTKKRAGALLLILLSVFPNVC